MPELAALCARAVDQAVKRIVDDCHRQALEILARERGRLDGLAEALLERESLDEREILEVVGMPTRRAAEAAA